MSGGRVFVAPQATGLQIDDPLAAFGRGNFQTQVEFGADQHRQLADQHQPVFRDIAQVADGFAGDAVEHFQEVRQLMPLDSAVGEHVRFRYARLLSRAALLLRNGCALSPGPLSPVPVRQLLQRMNLLVPVTGVAPFQRRGSKTGLFNYSSAPPVGQRPHDNRDQNCVGFTAAALRNG
jgi:hypothetical protein